MAYSHRWTYRSLTSARRALAAALADAAGDNPGVEEDSYAADLVEAVALDCSPDAAAELCRTELGWIPSALLRLRPDVAKYAARHPSSLLWDEVS
jgi:hypothetical protein